MAPIDKFPNEILAHLFRQCEGEQLTIPCKPTQTPWVLSRVSSRWRGVALGTRELWNNLSLNYTHSWKYWNRKSDALLAEMFGEILSRSGITPLSISLADWTVESDAVVTKLLAPHFNRLCDLKINEQFPLFLSEGLPSLPSLKSIEFGQDVKSEAEVDFAFLQNAPNLTHIGCQSFGLGTSLLDFVDQLLTLPTLSQVTTLHLSGVYLSQNEAVSLLLRCDSLVDCQLRVSSTGWSSWGLPPNHVMPSLESLHLDIPTGDFKPFRIFEFPRLTSFTLSGNPTDGEWFLEPLASAKRLELFMALDPVTIPLKIIQGLLEDKPCLRVLHLGHGTTLPTAVIEGVASGRLVPKLEILYSMISASGDDLDRHLDILENRALESTPATSLSVMILRIAESAKVSKVKKHPRVRKLRDAGCCIQIEK